MSGRGAIIDQPGARTLLGLLGDAPCTGDALAMACGIACVVALQPSRPWMLTRKGRSTLRRPTLKDDTGLATS